MRVGDYVRTNRGIIAKIIKVNSTGSITCDRSVYYGFNIVNNKRILKDFSSIVKSRPNIIDLIKKGDYVNGMLVTNIWIDKETGNIEFEFNNHESYLYPKSWNYESRVTKYKIKSIVTKEQFSQMEYRIGE